ncbi:MAG: hypothetical protein M1831_006548 [Alyxoria varia]|nr:MAG: hypothetical protein M1831_006548 [Alyxoria varia]
MASIDTTKSSQASHTEGPQGQRHERIPTFKEGDVSGEGSLSSQNAAENDISLPHKMLSAVSGSILTSLLVTPLDVVRVRVQSQQQGPRSAESKPSVSTSSRPFNHLPPNLGVTACCREVFWVNNNADFCVANSAVSSIRDTASNASLECSMEETQRRSYNSTVDGFRKIAKNEGFSTLWRGLSATLAMAVPGNVIYFAGYDWLRTSHISPIQNRVSDLYAPLIAGSSARVIAALFVSPIELFRTRMQASHAATAAGNFWETLTGVREMVKSQGSLTLWRGLSLTLWRDVPFSALYWWGYEAIRNGLTDLRDRPTRKDVDRSTGPITRKRADSRHRQNHATTLVDSFVAGALSGGAASIVTTPFDVGKTRQQVYKHSGDSKGSLAPKGAARIGPEDSSMPRFLWHIFKQEGMGGLFKGWTPRVMKVAPACAIMISSYEIGKKFAKGVKDKKEE